MKMQEIDQPSPDTQPLNVEIGHLEGVAQTQSADPIAVIVNASRAYQQLMRSEKPLENQVKAYWRMLERFTSKERADAMEKEFKKSVRKLKRVVPPEKSFLVLEAVRLEVDPVVYIIDVHRASLERYRNEEAKILEGAAKELPVWPWVERTPGIGPLGLALIIGAAGGPLWPNYPNPGKLWKRLGLAVINGEAQKRRKGEKKKGHGPDIVHDIEECKTCLAMFSGFAPTRRAVMHNVGESLMKQNKVDGEPGKYYAMYLDRKAYEAERDPKMKPGYCHARALRYMEKNFIKDLWNEWKRCA
ncbi:MAG: hypothetical protein ACYS4W_14800 [Planctomycetota bacterium]|jgi:hypothetical protein